MKKLTTLIFLFGFAFFLSASATAFAEDRAVDKVILIDGTVVSGRIISEAWDKVVCGPRSIETTKVSRIAYYDTPPDYIEALELIDRGSYENAEFKLKLALDQTSVREWLKLAVAIQRADIAWRLGKMEDARKQYRDINSNNSDSRYVRLVLWRIAQSLLIQGDYANAEGAFDNIFKDARFQNEPLRWRAKFWQVYTLEARSKYLDAYTEYLDAKNKIFNGLSQAAKDAFFYDRNASPEDRELINLHVECTFRGHLTQALSGKIADAIDEFGKLAKKPTRSLIAAGTIGLAICDVIKLEALRDLDSAAISSLNKARISLAKSLIFMASTDDRRADVFYWCGRAAMLGDDTTSAKAYFSMVTTRYPTSLVARKCEDLLAKVTKGGVIEGN